MKAFGVIALIVGVAVAVWGFVRLNSISSQFWAAVGYTDNAAYGAIAFGVIAAIVGLAFIFKPRRA